MPADTIELYDSHSDRFYTVTADYEWQSADRSVGVEEGYLVYISDVFDDQDRSVEPAPWMEDAFAQELYDREERRSRP